MIGERKSFCLCCWQMMGKKLSPSVRHFTQLNSHSIFRLRVPNLFYGSYTNKMFAVTLDILLPRSVQRTLKTQQNIGYTQLVWPLFDYQPHQMKLGIGIAANMILVVLDSPISVMWQGQTCGLQNRLISQAGQDAYSKELESLCL